MTGFEPQTFGIGIDRSTTTSALPALPAPLNFLLCCLFRKGSLQ